MSGPARRKRWGWAAAVLAGGLLLAWPAVAMTAGSCPASGEAITTKAEQVKEFTLLRAYPDQKNDGLSLALEFSRPWSAPRISTRWCASRRRSAPTTAAGPCPMTA